MPPHDEQAAMDAVIEDLAYQHTRLGGCYPLAPLGINAVIAAAWQARGAFDERRAERLERQLRILDQAINWTIIEIDRDCREGSIGAAWRDRLKDAKQRAALAEPAPVPEETRS